MDVQWSNGAQVETHLTRRELDQYLALYPEKAVYRGTNQLQKSVVGQVQVMMFVEHIGRNT